tara:strand:- start:723 stop:1331 length:609 start_codon:yes stop_codon:yes gene_type:complete
MQQLQIINTLINDLKFSRIDLKKLKKFVEILLTENKKHNLIAKSTENSVWHRHILDSAQMVKFINFKASLLVDLGSGAGFPGLILAMFNKNPDFHVKLYEKSPVKREFLKKVIRLLNLKAEVDNNIYDKPISADIFVCRAFKKLEEILKISREIKKPHKILILKGKNAQEEINRLSLDSNYSYKIEKSITDIDSKIIIFEVI